MHISRRDFLGTGAGAAACGALGAVGHKLAAAEDPETDYSSTVYKVYPVGRVRNKKGQPVQLQIFEKHIPALHRLEHCSEVMVLWWFHKSDTPEKRGIMKVHPRGNKSNPLTGVFATHAPVRPNLIAVTTCKVLSVEGGIVTVDKIDAFDDTPILDLKSAGTRKEPDKKGK